MRGSGARASPLREVVGVMGKLGFIGFGGPAAHVALLREETVVSRSWVSEQEFLDLLGTVSALPGPTSTQLSMVLSRRRAGWLGLVLGGACFILPAMAIVLGLAVAYVHWGTTVAAGGVFYGVKPVVIAIVAHALWGLLRNAVRGRVLLAAGAIGAFVAYSINASTLLALATIAIVVMLVDNARRLRLHSSMFAPVFLLSVSVRTRHAPRLVEVFLEFLKLGVVVFGSGYVLLAFLRRDLVTDYHWISTRQLLDAVAVGQFTPGPVFTTATFVGYLVGGTGGAVLATLGIFLPSFVMVMLLAPLVPRLRRSPWTGSALDGLNAGAVGLMAGVSVDLARSALPDALTIVVAAVALLALTRRRANAVVLIGAGAVVGLAHALL